MPLYDVVICCLRPNEEVVARVMATAFEASLLAPVPVVIWDAAWIPDGGDWEARKAADFQFWGMYDTEIPVPDSDPIPAIGTTATDWWQGLIDAIAVDGLPCDDGCAQSRYWDGV